jgi:hypothetical protein
MLKRCIGRQCHIASRWFFGKTDDSIKKAMRAIQSILPNPRHTEIKRIFVKALPAVAWEKARHFDASAIPWIQLLFDICTFSEKLAGKSPTAGDRRIGVDQIANNGKK